MPPHNWYSIHRGCVRYIALADNALVRTKPSPDGRYMWQFRKTVSYADTIGEAMGYVEAGVEFFDVMRRNPYAA